MADVRNHESDGVFTLGNTPNKDSLRKDGPIQEAYLGG